jgi:hypothetical protein
MPFKFKPEEVEKLKSILTRHPEGESVLNALSDMMALQDLANDIKFPVNSFRELMQQLGPEKTVDMAGTKMKVEDMKRLIPAYYFPMNSEEDFLDKAAELMKRQPGLQMEGAKPETGKLMPIELAPPIPAELRVLKTPAHMAGGGGIGYTREEIERGGGQ